MKYIYYIITAIILLILFYYIFLASSLDLTEEPTHITEHSLGEKESISFVDIDSPLSASYIQVRKINKETKEEYLLESYKNYDNMVGYTLSKDTLIIYLRRDYWLEDSSDFVKCDTFHLNINDIKRRIK